MLGRSCAAALEREDSSTCCNTQAFHPNPHKVLLIRVITLILLAPTNLLSLSQSLSLGSGLWPVLLSATVSPETSEVTSTLRVNATSFTSESQKTCCSSPEVCLPSELASTWSPGSSDLCSLVQEYSPVFEQRSTEMQSRLLRFKLQ